MPDPSVDINSFRNAIRLNQGSSFENRVIVEANGDESRAQVQDESFLGRSFRKIHQSKSDKISNREARRAFWEAISSAYTRREIGIPESIRRALSEDGVELTPEAFKNSDKPLSARTVERVLKVMDLDLNLIEKVREEVTSLQERATLIKKSMENEAFGLPPSDFDTKYEFVGIFDEAVRAKDFRLLCDNGSIETKRKALQEEEKKYEELSKGETSRGAAHEQLEECRFKLGLLEEFVKAGRAYERVMFEIHEPLFAVVTEYQNMLKAYNNAVFCEEKKSVARCFDGDSDEIHTEMKEKAELNLSDVAWKDTLRLDASAREINALQPGHRAAYLYTMSSNHINAPLSGFAGNSFGAPNVGVGNTSWDEPLPDMMLQNIGGEDKNVGTAREHIPLLTEEINQHHNEEDFILYRGLDGNLLASMLGIRPDELAKLSKEDCDNIVWKEGYLPAFTSTSHSKKVGEHFMPDAKGNPPPPAVMMRVFCPKGTKMLYCQPFSYYAPQVKEFELLLQRGAHFRISHFEKTVRESIDGKKQDLYILEIEIHPERGYVMVKEKVAQPEVVQPEAPQHLELLPDEGVPDVHLPLEALPGMDDVVDK